MRLGIADGRQHQLHAELITAVEAAGRQLGIAVERIADATGEARVDVLLMLGYPHYYPDIEAGPRMSRRIAWYGENLPHQRATAAQRLARSIPSARLLDLAHDTLGRVGGRRTRRRLLERRESAAIQRELGRNVAELRRARAWIDELVVVSGNRVAGARLCGWDDVRQVSFGYHAAMAGPLVAPEVGPRDIDVLFLGRDLDARVRRARMLAEFRARLGDRARLTVVDRGYYGVERHALIARARVVVDIHRLPSNSTGIRYVLTTAGGAALVNEQTHDAWLDDLDDYVVEVPAQRLADEVLSLLGDEPRRRRMVEAGQQLLRSELAMTTSLERVLRGPADNMPPTG